MKLENKLDKEKLLALVGESASEEKRPYTDFENSTYQVVSKFAYLIGVPYRILENEHEPPQMKWYDELKKDKTPVLSATYASCAPLSSAISGG